MTFLKASAVISNLLLDVSAGSIEEFGFTLLLLFCDDLFNPLFEIFPSVLIKLVEEAADVEDFIEARLSAFTIPLAIVLADIPVLQFPLCVFCGISASIRRWTFKELTLKERTDLSLDLIPVSNQHLLTIKLLNLPH
jgi:hypothetical protein